MELHAPAFFNRGPSALARFLVFGGMSLVMVISDSRWHYLQPLRMATATVVEPLEHAAISPLRLARVTTAYFSDQQKILDDNAALRTDALRTQSQILREQALEAENRELRSLLQLREQSQLLPVRQGLAAEILFDDRDPFHRRVLLNRGALNEVHEGSIVIDAHGLVGQITRVLPSTSELTLVSDKNQVVPIQIQRTGLRAVMYGLGGENGMEIRFLAPNADVRPDDVLVSSGLDGIYPAGVPVATVVQVEHGGAQNFARVTCATLGAPDRFRQVLILPPADTVVAPATPVLSAHKAAGRKH